MNPIFVNNSGQGRPLLVLHGWGMNQSVWTPLKSQLEQHCRVSWVDLPGHGKSKGIRFGSLQQVVEQIAELIEQPLHVMGWSLGGIIAQALATTRPDLVHSLILLASTPSFVQRTNWPAGLPVELVASFVDNLEEDFAATIKRFIALQFMGVKGIKSRQQQLIAEILQDPPSRDALYDGLQVLLTADLSAVKQHCPQHWIFGQLDKLIPVATADAVTARGLASSVKIIPGAGHAPFISHAGSIAHHIVNCLQAEAA